MKLDLAVGQRIARAREFLGLTQALVAERMQLARTTQVAIEQGHRAVSVAEMQRYGEILGRPLSYFFGEGVWSEDSGFRAVFRQISERLDATPAGPPRRPGRPRGSLEAPPEKLALMAFESLCRHHVDLQRLNRLPLPRLPDLPVPTHHTGHEAELLAATVRAHLDLGGEAPLHDLRRFLEQAFGLSVFVMDDVGRLEAAAFHHPLAGACVLLARTPVRMLRFELARALGHLLANRDLALVRVAGAAQRGAVAAFASAFAGALLVPPRGLRERYAAAAFERGEGDLLALVHLARLYGVSMSVLRGRLQSLRLLAGGPATPREMAETAAPESDPASGNGHHGASFAETELAAGDEGAAPWARLPERYVFLALRAYRKGLIDAARLGECLLTDESAARAALLAYERGADT